jgi:hypothetical protein
VLIIGAVAASSLAAQPDDRRAGRGPGSRPVQDRLHKPADDRGGGMNFPGVANPINEQEKQDTLSFATQNMPVLSEMWSDTANFPRFARQRTWLLSVAAFQYKRYSNGKKDFPELEAKYLSDAKTTDEVLGLIRQRPSASASVRTIIDTEIHTKLRAIADNYLAERHMRLDKARKSLEALEERLRRDEEQVDDSVKSGADKMINNLSIGARGGAPGQQASPGNGTSRP